MAELFQRAVMHAGLLALALCVPLWVLARHADRPGGRGLLAVALRRLRKLRTSALAALASVLVAAVAYSGKNTNGVQNLPPRPLQPPVPVQSPLEAPSIFDFPRTVTETRAAAGFALVGVGTNETFAFGPTAGAEVCADWRMHGSASRWTHVSPTNFAFPFGGTNATTFTFVPGGVACLAGGAAAPRLMPFGAEMGIAPERCWNSLGVTSRLWTATSPSNTFLATWQGALLGRRADRPVDVQLELFPDGGFVFHYGLSRLASDDDLADVRVGALNAGGGEVYSIPSRAVTSARWRPVASGDAVDPDRDGDGVTTVDELFFLGTDPGNPDSDYDGLTDYEELFVHRTDPLNAYSTGGVYSDGFALKIGGENPFAYPEGSTNTVLEHVFYSGTTNGAFAYPQSSDGMAVLRVSVSGSGTGDLIVGNQVVPLVAPPQMRSGPSIPPLTLLVQVMKGETYRLYRRGSEELNVMLDSDDFAFGSLPAWGAYGSINFPNTVATPACIHDFNARRKRVSLPISRDADAMACTWDAGMSMDVVVSNIPPRSATIMGSFSARSDGGVTYTLSHPRYLFGQTSYEQAVRFCPRPPDPDPDDPDPEEDPPWYDGGEGDDSEAGETSRDERWCCFWGTCDGSCGCGDAGCCGSPSGGSGDMEDFDEECPVHSMPYAACAGLHASAYTNAAENVQHLGGVLYIRDPPLYEQIHLDVSGEHRHCCPCPDHWTNYVGVAYKSYRLRLTGSDGLPFRLMGTSCDVGLAGVRPSSAVGDATLAFVRNGVICQQHDKTVLGVAIKSNAVDLAAYDALNPDFGYPMTVRTNLTYASEPDMKLVTNVRLPGGNVHLELSEATAPFTVWYYDRRTGVFRKLLDTASTPVKDLSMAYWKALMKRAVDGSSNELPIYITSSTPGHVDLTFRYWNVIGGKFVQDEATQRITSVNPPLLVDYNRDGQVNAVDVLHYLAGRLAYFWVNDDTWKDDDAFAYHLANGVNSSDEVVNGRNDLINFLPIAVDIAPFASHWGQNDVYYRLETYSTALMKSKLVFADIGRSQIGDMPLGGDMDIDGNAVCEAPVSAIGGGTNLPSAFVTLSQLGRSTLLMEFPEAARWHDLFLNVYSKSDDALLFSSSIKLHVGEVPQMIGWSNLRSVAGGSGGVPTRLATPDWPAEAHEPGNVVFVHGYNMEEDEETPLWAQNVFKKLWWAGLDRGFVAVQWRGNEGQTPLDLPELGYVTPNYYGNVQNAFATASAFKTAMDGVSGPKWFIAHSLGNMLVSAAIQDYGMQYEKYFMLNAAVAMEAFDPTGGITQESHDKMTPEGWTNYTDRVRATHWFERFPAGDGRRLLTWKGRFANVTNIVNFYSTQEEVVNNGDGDWHPITVRNYVWYNQETRKGVWPLMLHEYEGGWEFNGYYNITTNYWIGNTQQTETYHMPPATADQLSDGQLQQIPFFLDFHNPEMHTSSNGAIVANNYLYRAEMLAYTIPAESFAVGANPLPGGFSMPTNGSTHVLYDNYDMATVFTSGRDDLPGNHATDTKKMHRDWQHSTFVQRSFKRVHQLYKAIFQHIKETHNE